MNIMIDRNFHETVQGRPGVLGMSRLDNVEV